MSGIYELKLKQESDFVKGRVVFLSLPTGFGKSLHYNIMTLILCVSLTFDKIRSSCKRIAIMEDHVSNSVSNGLTAGFVINDLEYAN